MQIAQKYGGCLIGVLICPQVSLISRSHCRGGEEPLSQPGAGCRREDLSSILTQHPYKKLSMGEGASNPSTEETETGGFPGLTGQPGYPSQGVPGKPRLKGKVGGI